MARETQAIMDVSSNDDGDRPAYMSSRTKLSFAALFVAGISVGCFITYMNMKVKDGISMDERPIKMQSMSFSKLEDASARIATQVAGDLKEKHYFAHGAAMSHATAKLLSEILNGKQPKAAASQGNPVLGVSTTYIINFLGGLLGSKPPNIVELILKEYELLIKPSNLEAQIRANRKELELQGLVEELDWVPQITAGHKESEGSFLGLAGTNSDTGEKQTQLSFYLAFQTSVARMKLAVFHASCLQTTQPNAQCTEWEKAGTIVHAIMFVNLQLAMLVEIARLESSYTAHISRRILELGKEYMPVLYRSLATFANHRLSFVTPFKKVEDHIEGGIDTFDGKDMICDDLERKVSEKLSSYSRTPVSYDRCAWRRRNEIVKEMQTLLDPLIFGIREIFVQASTHAATSPPPSVLVADTIKMCMMVKLDEGWTPEEIDDYGYYPGFCRERSPDEVCEDISNKADKTGEWITATLALCQSPLDNKSSWAKVCKLTDMARVWRHYSDGDNAWPAHSRIFKGGLVEGLCKEDVDEDHMEECKQPGWQLVDYATCKDFKTDQVMLHQNQNGVCSKHYKSDEDADIAKCYELCKVEPNCYAFSWDPQLKCRYSSCSPSSADCPANRQCTKTNEGDYPNGMFFELRYRRVGQGICDWHYKSANVILDECYWLCLEEKNCKRYTWDPKNLCSYSVCGSNPGPHECPSDRQCPVRLKGYETSTIYEVANKIVQPRVISTTDDSESQFYNDLSMLLH